jgi:hypothetical protein
MLSKVLMVGVFALAISVIPQLAYAGRITAPTYSLSANDVKALHGAIASLSTSQVRALSSSSVEIARQGQQERVTFRTSGKEVAVVVDSASGEVASGANPNATVTSSVALPGNEARSVALAYDSWKSGTSSGPSREALDSGAFSVDEVFIGVDQNTVSKGSYLVIYKPLGVRSPPPGPVSCPNSINYLVNLETNRVVRQPHIC